MTYRFAMTLVMLLVLVCFSASHAAIITINSTADTTTTGCTLRLAIAAANTDSSVGGCVAGSGADQLNFAVPGTVVLTSSLPPITDEISINGFSTTQTVIDGNGQYRIFEIHAQQDPSQLAESRISDITLTRGLAGALNIRIGNDVEVVNATIINNVSSGGAGINLQNSNTAEQGVRLSLISSNIESNIADGASGGGGIRAGIGSSVFISSSSIVRNRATHPNAVGGGLNLFGGGGSADRPVSSAVVTNSTFAVNTTSQHGGGINVSGIGTTIEIVASTITSNISDADLMGGGGLGAGLRLDPGVIISLRGSIIASNFRGFLADDIGVPGSALPPSITSSGFNLIGTNSSVPDYFTAGQPNANNDYVGTPSDSLNAEAMLESLAFDESSQTNYRPFSETSLARNNAGQCGLELDQLQRSRGVCECDIGAYEFFESSPDNTSCQSNFFVIPLANGKSVIVEL